MKTKHKHEFKRMRQNATVEICACGKWQHTENNRNSIIVEKKAD